MAEINNLVGQEIPQEILDQLKIINRIKFPLKSTVASAVSTSAQVPVEGPDDLVTVEKELDEIISKVDFLETLVEELEDLTDTHLKDMSIPPVNATISAAASRLGSPTGNITKDVLDKAIAIIDYFPIMSLGQDPVLAALVGNGTIDGNWMQCDKITAGLAKQFTLKNLKDYKAEDDIPNQQQEIVEQHNKRLEQMVVQILLMLWWNMLWAKFLVDMSIINPTRLLVATPMDGLIGFFQAGKTPVGKPFTRKNKEWIQGNGLLNKLVTRVRLILLCKLPPLLWSEYQPPKDLDCSKISNCPPPLQANTKEPGKELKGLKDLLDEATSDQPCEEAKSFIGDFKSVLPTGLGASPDCVQAAKVVLDAVLADALKTKGSAASALAEKMTITEV